MNGQAIQQSMSATTCKRHHRISEGGQRQRHDRKKLSVYADNFEHVGQLTTDLEDEGYYVDSITKKLESINLFHGF